MLEAIGQTLVEAGATLTTASDAEMAIAALDRRDLDVVVADVCMPRVGGLAVLRALRESDLDASCIIITASPEVESAVEALRLGAFDYMGKAEAGRVLPQVVARAGTMARLARLKREAQGEMGRPSMAPGDLMGLDVALTQTLGSLRMAYQPIVGRDGLTFGYEALMRSSEAALPHPGAVLAAAERLGRLSDVGLRTRLLVGEELRRLPEGILCFFNLHPSDLGDRGFMEDRAFLEGHGHRLVLEVTEREALDRLPDVRGAVSQLREKGCRIAVDDLGAGYAGLSTFAQLLPDIVKIDMSLVRGVDQNPRTAHIIGGIVALFHDLGVTVVAEGIETIGERDELLRLGCDLFQGYLIAKPAAGFPAPRWPEQAARDRAVSLG
ncbi:MAG: EAL domain-containing protein [Polyangiaceae bacterium]|nr:EAL domain-containing protein [Polyangiaceae bacterium]